MDFILKFLMTTPPKPPATPGVEGWWKRHQVIASRFENTGDAALAAGFVSDSPAWAFASGVQSAARALMPSLDPASIAAFAVNESPGTTPSNMSTDLRPHDELEGMLRLWGRKPTVTLGSSADVLFVAARHGVDAAGRPRARIARIERSRARITQESGPRMPFLPEIEHVGFRFDGVDVGENELLEGDGWDDWAKPFRVLEDIHVHAAICGYLFQIARRSEWPMGARDELLALLVASRGLCTADPKSPAVHVAVGAALMRLKTWLRTLGKPYWDRVSGPVKVAWERDKAVLDIAGPAQRKRLEAAMQALGMR